MTAEEKENVPNAEKDFETFMDSEGLDEHNKIPVEKVKFSKGVRVAFWFLRIYIAVMVVLVVIGFSHVV